MIVIFNPKTPHVLTVPLKGNPKKAIVTGSVVLRPGSNQVNNDQWEYMHTILKSKIDSGEIKMLGEMSDAAKKGELPKVEKAESLAEMSPEKAVEMVAQCINVDTLNEWKKIPKLSDEVRFAITKQLEEIGVEGKTKKKKDEK